MTDEKKWYDNKAVAVILLIIFPPVGLYAFWKNRTFSVAARVSIVLVWAILMIVGNTIDTDSEKTTESEKKAKSVSWSPYTASAEELEELEGKYEILYTRNVGNTIDVHVFIKAGAKIKPVILKIWRLLLAHNYEAGQMWDVRMRMKDEKNFDLSSFPDGTPDAHMIAHWMVTQLTLTADYWGEWETYEIDYDEHMKQKGTLSY
ncbi:hypothetical protein JXQ70_06625 [bacterium]|nr:hypothetical protein [bacterium]